jgi:hypothetical protein
VGHHTRETQFVFAGRLASEMPSPSSAERSAASVTQQFGQRRFQLSIALLGFEAHFRLL